MFSTLLQPALRRFAPAAMAALLLLGVGWARGDDPVPPPVLEPITKKEVQEQLQQLSANTTLDETTRSHIRELLEQTLQEIEKLAKHQADAEGFRLTSETATFDAARARRELEQLDSIPLAAISTDLSMAELREQLASKEADLPVLRGAAAAAEEEANRRAERRKKISQLLADLPKKIATIESQLATPPAAEAPEELVAAQRNYLSAQHRTVKQQIATLKSERSAYDATVEILPVKRRLTALQLERAELDFEQVQAAIAKQQREDVEKQLRDAELLLASADEKHRPAAEESVQFSRQRLEIRSKLDAAKESHDTVARQLADLRNAGKRTRRQIRDTGLTTAVAQLLRRHRAEILPDEKSLRSRIAERKTEVQTLQHSIFELEDRQRQLEAANGRGSDIPSVRQFRLESLDLLLSDSQAYFYKLVDLDTTEQELLAESLQYEQFIDENALWIRGADFFQPVNLRHAADGLLWLVRPDGWQAVGKILSNEFFSQPVLTLIVALALMLLIYFAGRADRQILDLGERAMRATTQKITPTLWAFVLTVLSAAPWPSLMAYLGWRLEDASASRDFSYALGVALLQTALPFFLMMLARQTCRAKGLAGAHFNWTDTDLAPLRRLLRLLMVFTLPLIFVASFFSAAENPLWRHSIGSASIVLIGLLFAWFAHRLLRPGHGVLYRVSIAARSGWLHHGRYALYLLAVITPLVPAGLALSGYYLAAMRLSERALFSALLLFGLLLLGSLLFRWVLVTRRWIAIQNARQRILAAQATAALQRVSHSQETTPAEGAPLAVAPTADDRAMVVPEEPPPVVVQEPEIDLASITSQTRRFLWAFMSAAAIAGLWMIWVDVLPSLGVLHRIELWHTSVNITETVETVTGTVISRQVPRLEAVTLADLFYVLIIIVMSVVAARNLPGLMEMGLWQRLPLDSGARFAISAATRYTIFIGTVLVVSNMLGFAWSKVGWLVAALTVGLGFGLQEIFANFVSGLIVLAERPVRVGDMVTIGKINGTVTKIQMRATTIRDWNHRELVVPNKKLVTENLINWTLTDSNYRVDLILRLAFGSDTDKAREILLQIAARHAKILEKPRPKAIFRAFGPSALEIEYRIYIPHMDFWPRVVTEVNTAIAREFKQAGIEIAYPQQDIHIRTPGGERTVFESFGQDQPAGPKTDGNG